MHAAVVTDPQQLSDLMDFDHVIRVASGYAGSADSVFAPGLNWSEEGGVEIDGTGWTLMEGYSGQDRYTGPIMHSSEQIGGRMAEDILGRDGYYVALVCEDMDDRENPAGWAIAYRAAL